MKMQLNTQPKTQWIFFVAALSSLEKLVFPKNTIRPQKLHIESSYYRGERLEESTCMSRK